MPMTVEELIKTRTQTEWPYRVDIDSGKNDEKMRKWCKKNCKENYHVLHLGTDLHIARFKSERDMILFTLTWS
jgi:3-keto-L-gulonate-6-phosphate decarboxylase